MVGWPGWPGWAGLGWLPLGHEQAGLAGWPGGLTAGQAGRTAGFAGGQLARQAASQADRILSTSMAKTIGSGACGTDNE